MRIVLVTPSYAPQVGGLEGSVHSLAEALRNHGATVSIIANSTGAAPSRETVDGIQIYRMGLLPRRHERTSRQWVARGLRNSVSLALRYRRLRADVVSAHFIGESAAWAVLASKIDGIPLVVTAHGSDLKRFARESKRYRLMATLVLKRSAYVTAVSRDLLAAASTLVPGIAAKGEVIPSGVDLKYFEQFDGAEAPVRKPYLAIVGRLEQVKGQDIMIQAFRTVLASCPDLTLVLAGEGSMRRELEILAASGDAASRTVFLGEASRKEVAQLLAGCELLVMPSRSEGTPNAILEAMAAGKAVVATRTGGIPEIVDDDATGLLVLPEDGGALAHAIIRLLQDPDKRGSMGRRAREIVAERYQWDQVATRYLSVFEGVVGKHRTASTAT